MAAARYAGCLIVAVSVFVNGFVVMHSLGQAYLATSNANRRPEEPFQVMADLVVPFGYPLTEHFAETADGYILRLFRIGPKESPDNEQPDPAASPSATTSGPTQSKAAIASQVPLQEGSRAPGSAGSCSRPAAFLQHPLMGSSVDYVALGPGRGLAFLLVDAGYDVWLTNVRGNRFSRNHTSLEPDRPDHVEAFWAFSLDQHVALDLPAALEAVAAASGCPRMAFVGYSQGTTIGLAALASQPRVAARVSAAALLAPVAFVTHMNSPPFRAMAQVRVERLFHLLGLHEYAAHVPWFADVAARFCWRFPRPCTAYLFMLCGTNPHGNLDPGMVPTIMHFLPSGTSVQNMAHWGQLVRSFNPTRLSYYDYGNDCNKPDGPSGTPRTGGQHACNQEAYNASAPLEYPLPAISTPLALFTGGRDRLADPWDTSLLLEALRPGGAVRLHHDEPDYGHLDFGVGHDAADRVYPLVLDFFQKYALEAASSGAGAVA